MSTPLQSRLCEPLAELQLTWMLQNHEEELA